MKIFSSLVTRLIIFFALFFSSIFFPLYFLLPIMSEKNYILLGVLIAIIAILEIILFIFICIETYVKPIAKINDAAKKMTMGEYDTSVNLKFVDRDLKNLSLNINNIANEFESLEQMRKSFVSNVSHELRSPLTSMQGFLQAMLDGTIEDKDRNQYLEIVLSETKRLSLLINSMLDLSRLESGSNPLNMSAFNINELTEQVLQKLTPNLIAKNIGLSVDFVRDESYVYADREKITQVLINLIDNAIKYSSDGSEISVTTHIHGRKIYVAVKDNGIGISKKEQMLIWDRFYMADKARTPAKNKGTGLGLSIVKQIIDDHKETIWVESTKGAGATFIFTLAMYDAAKSGKHIGNALDTNEKQNDTNAEESAE